MLIEAVTGCQAASSSTATRDHLTLVEEQQGLPWAMAMTNAMLRHRQTQCQGKDKLDVNTKTNTMSGQPKKT